MGLRSHIMFVKLQFITDEEIYCDKSTLIFETTEDAIQVFSLCVREANRS